MEKFPYRDKIECLDGSSHGPKRNARHNISESCTPDWKMCLGWIVIVEPTYLPDGVIGFHQSCQLCSVGNFTRNGPSIAGGMRTSFQLGNGTPVKQSYATVVAPEFSSSGTRLAEVLRQQLGLSYWPQSCGY
jgi:hypothetical protein